MNNVSKNHEISSLNENTVIVEKDGKKYVKKRVSCELTYIYKILVNNHHENVADVVDIFEYVSNWEKYQSVERLKEIREYNRLAQQKSRQKKKLLQNVNDMSLTSQPCQDTDEDIDIDKRNKNLDIDKDLEEEDSTPQAEVVSTNCPYVKIKDLYHKICISYPKIKTIDGNRKKAVSARWRTYKSLDKFEEMFTLAESSSFLKGENDRNWSADFDWMMKATNFSKILEGKYVNRVTSGETKMTGALGVLQKMYEESDEAVYDAELKDGR